MPSSHHPHQPAAPPSPLTRHPATPRHTPPHSATPATIKFWQFQTHALLETVEAGAPIAQLELARDSGLLAAACDDFVVRVFDANGRQLVRRLEGHTGHITDLTFSPDAHRIYSAAHDGRSVSISAIPAIQRCQRISE